MCLSSLTAATSVIRTHTRARPCAVLLECELQDNHARVLQRLRERLAVQAPHVTEVDVDRIQDVGELRRLLREAQKALSRFRT